MLNLLPNGTTWLDIATLVTAFAALALTIRRDRALGRVGVSMRATVAGDKVIVGLTNSERRTVSIEAAGIASRRSVGGFEQWDATNHRIVGHMLVSDPALPVMLEAGAPTTELRAPLSRAKGTAASRSSGLDLVQGCLREDALGPRAVGRCPTDRRSEATRVRPRWGWWIHDRRARGR